MRYSFFLVLFLIVFSPFCHLSAYKIVGLVPVRNECIFIAQCLKALSKYTDAIIILDDASTDATLEIVKSLAHECNVERIIKKDTWYRDEPGDKNRLLKIGREIGGTHFIVLDADEMLTANFVEQDKLRKIIFQLKPGDTLSLCWIQLWRSIHQYRFDNSVWTWNYKTVIFADNGTASYTSAFIHTAPIPNGLYGKKFQIKGYIYGLLHFQFVHWRNLLIKQAWYRCLERIRYPNKSDFEINKTYEASKNENNLKTKPSRQDWFEKYNFFDESLFEREEIWREQQVLAWFKHYGKTYFEGLDIWDVNWGASLS